MTHAVSSTYYSAARTEYGCLITCWHHHRTVREAVACIRSAGGYVVAVDSGLMRSLTVGEEVQFQYTVRAGGERRVALERRRRVAEMSPEEMRRELLTSDVTGLPNRRAFDEAGVAPAVAMSDVDGLKALNNFVI
jgi:hypothetical protein